MCLYFIKIKIRGERRDGANNNDSYVAFRRRTEKMQTRKVLIQIVKIFNIFFTWSSNE